MTGALAPSYVIRWHIGFYPTTLLEVALLVTLAIFAVESIRQQTMPVWWTPFAIPGLLLLLAGLLSVAVAPDHRAALGLYRAYFVEPAAFFVLLVSVLRTPARALLVVGGMLVGGLAVAIPNLLLYAHLLGLPTSKPGEERTVLIYSATNAVPLFLVPLIALALAMLVYSRDRRVRPALVVFLGIAIAASVLTYSRGGFAALAAVALGLALTHRSRIWSVPGALIGLLLLSRIPGIATRLSSAFHLAEDPRAHLWSSTLGMMRQHLVLGTGLSGYAHAMEGYDPAFKERYNAEPIYPHNLFLNFWTVTGILGLLAFVWLLLQGAWTAWKGWRQSSGSWRALHLGVLLALLAVLVHGQVDVPYLKNDLSVQFWMLLGLTMAGAIWDRAGSAAGPLQQIDDR